jgi:hypothetical protein
MLFLSKRCFLVCQIFIAPFLVCQQVVYCQYFRLQMEQLEKQARCCSEESDEGLGHSGSDGESNRTGSPTLNGCNGAKMENPEGMEGMVEVDADGKRKEDLYKCRFCDRTFCYLCHLKVCNIKIFA